MIHCVKYYRQAGGSPVHQKGNPKSRQLAGNHQDPPLEGGGGQGGGDGELAVAGSGVSPCACAACRRRDALRPRARSARMDASCYTQRVTSYIVYMQRAPEIWFFFFF